MDLLDVLQLPFCTHTHSWLLLSIIDNCYSRLLTPFLYVKNRCEKNQSHMDFNSAVVFVMDLIDLTCEQCILYDFPFEILGDKMNLMEILHIVCS